ncbi:MAG: hypothetical protein HeimC3_07730 [Candidatus Heimdallarchaeota archaeon LC_3]|nr:MAG: hypothetical protein HeimC3_07730 [Candidatus Heimdallarchaeota archaeon LC_3]
MKLLRPKNTCNTITNPILNIITRFMNRNNYHLRIKNYKLDSNELRAKISILNLNLLHQNHTCK